MARLTREQQDQATDTYFGIDANFDVKSVYLTRGGTLVMYGKDFAAHRQPLMRGRDPRTEIVMVYGLTEIVRVRTGDNEHEERVLKELREKSAAMKAAKG